MIRKVWSDREQSQLIARINKATDKTGRIYWTGMQSIGGRSIKALQIQWHRHMKQNHRWNGKKYVLINGIAKPVAQRSKPTVKKVHSFFWGLYKREVYETR